MRRRGLIWLSLLGVLALAYALCAMLLHGSDLVERLLSPKADPALLLPLAFVMLRLVLVFFGPVLGVLALFDLLWPKPIEAPQSEREEVLEGEVG